MKIESADGREGILIWCGGDRYVFRIYINAPEEFVDYDICFKILYVPISNILRISRIGDLTGKQERKN